MGVTLPMARDLAQHGIRVCTIAPGLFATPLMQTFAAGGAAVAGRQHSVPPRLGKPQNSRSWRCTLSTTPPQWRSHSSGRRCAWRHVGRSPKITPARSRSLLVPQPVGRQPMKAIRTLLATSLAAWWACAAHADINVGVILPLTGPLRRWASPARIPSHCGNQHRRAKAQHHRAMDDATDPRGQQGRPTHGHEDHADILLGSSTPPPTPWQQLAAESRRCANACAHRRVDPPSRSWLYNLPQSTLRMFYRPGDAHETRVSNQHLANTIMLMRFGELFLRDMKAKRQATGIQRPKSALRAPTQRHRAGAERLVATLTPS